MVVMSPLVVLSVLVLIASIIILILRALYLRKEIQTANRRTKQHHHPQHGNTNHNHNHKSHQRRTAPISTVVVLGSGGHTTEMLQLLDPLNPQQYTPLTFIVAQTDTTSLARVAVRTTNTGNKGRTADTVYRIPRSREVGQSYVSSIATTLWSLIYTLGLVVKIRPGLLLINGPGTCLPIAVWTFVGRLLGLWEGKIIFCESFCRVTSLSLTGKLLYPIVDLFVVHWEQLQAMYPKSHLVSTFVPRSSLSKQDETNTKKASSMMAVE